MAPPFIQPNCTLTFVVDVLTSSTSASPNPYQVTKQTYEVRCWLKQDRKKDLELQPGVDDQKFYVRGIAFLDEKPAYFKQGVEAKLVFDDGRKMRFQYHERILGGEAKLRELTKGIPIQGVAIC